MRVICTRNIYTYTEVFMEKIVYYLSPSSFCFWVKRSIDQLNSIVDQHRWEKIYCIHALVHNPKVTEAFEARWVKFVEDISKVNDSEALIIFSAHGTNRKVIEEAKSRYKIVYNLECPFVTKIYLEAENILKEGISKFLYIWKEHHQEGKNIIEYIRFRGGEVVLCESREKSKNIPYDQQERFWVLSQTTLNFSHVQNILDDIRERFPNAKLPELSDVCKATYERQTVIMDNLDKFDTLIVIGGKESNNTKELHNIGISNNKRTFFWESLDDIVAYGGQELFADASIAITGWASTPIEDIKAVFNYYKDHGYDQRIIELQ